MKLATIFAKSNLAALDVTLCTELCGVSISSDALNDALPFENHIQGSQLDFLPKPRKPPLINSTLTSPRFDEMTISSLVDGFTAFTSSELISEPSIVQITDSHSSNGITEPSFSMCNAYAMFAF